MTLKAQANHKNRIHMRADDYAVSIIAYVLSGAFALICFVPFLLVIICGMDMEALPLSCVAGWIGMFILEVPLLRKKLAEMKAEQ